MSRLPPPAAVVFDLDGTLVDTVAHRIEAWLTAFEEASIPSAREQLTPLIGMDGRRLAREVARAAGRELTDEQLEELDRRSGELFDERNRRPRVLPGARELLARLDDAGVTWAIATSSRADQVRASIGALGLAREPRIVDGSHVENAKPAPDLLLLAAERLRAAPESTWYVGDSTWDMRAAVAAGMTPVAVLAGAAVAEDALREAGAVTVVPTLDRLEIGG